MLYFDFLNVNKKLNKSHKAHNFIDKAHKFNKKLVQIKFDNNRGLNYLFKILITRTLKNFSRCACEERFLLKDQNMDELRFDLKIPRWLCLDGVSFKKFFIFRKRDFFPLLTHNQNGRGQIGLPLFYTSIGGVKNN